MNTLCSVRSDFPKGFSVHTCARAPSVRNTAKPVAARTMLSCAETGTVFIAFSWWTHHRRDSRPNLSGKREMVDSLQDVRHKSFTQARTSCGQSFILRQLKCTTQRNGAGSTVLMLISRNPSNAMMCMGRCHYFALCSFHGLA